MLQIGYIAKGVVDVLGKVLAPKPPDFEQNIFKAAKDGKLSSVIYLIENEDVRPDCKDRTFDTPLHYAALGGKLEVVAYLMENHHCNKEQGDKFGNRPIHLACQANSLDVIQYLVQEKGVFINEVDNQGNTPLHLACLEGNLQIVQYLISKGAHKEAETNLGFTPLHYACQRNALHIVKYLIEFQHVNPQPRAKNGDTPYKIAANQGYVGIIEYMTEKKYDDSTLINMPKDYICNLFKATSAGNLASVKYLVAIEHKYVNDRNRNGKIPLHIACEKGHLNIAEYLLENGSDVGATDNEMMQPIHFACLNGNLEIVQLLEKYNAKFNVCDIQGWDPIHFACHSGSFPLVRYLLEEKMHLQV